MYLGDQRMRRVKDQDEDGKGPVDQEDPGTGGPRDRGTKGPEDQGTRGAGDQSTRGTKGSGEPDISFPSIYIFSPQGLSFFSRKLSFFPVSSPLLILRNG